MFVCGASSVDFSKDVEEAHQRTPQFFHSQSYHPKLVRNSSKSGRVPIGNGLYEGSIVGGILSSWDGVKVGR
jgi:hypothetical protein